MFDNILKKAMKKGHNIENNNFKTFKPKKQFTISDKPVQVFNNNPIPNKSVIKKAYDKIPDDTSIPLQFMTRKQYMNKYIKNQEHINGIDFPSEQEKAFIKQRTPHYSNITGRYTTRNNPYYPPAVVVFNDKNNLKNIKGKNFEKLAWHEYGHELVEKKNIKLPLHKEEYFADRIADIGTTNKIFCDNKAKNQVFEEIFERKIDKRNRIADIRMANIYQERFPENDELSRNKLNFWKKKEEPEPVNYPDITNDEFRQELEYRQRLQQDSYGEVTDYSGTQVGNTMIAADVVIPSGKLLTAAGFGVKKYVDKVKLIKTDEHDNKYRIPRIEVHRKQPETDDYSYDKYEQEAQEYIQCPVDNKGKGRCADAAQSLVTTAIQEGIPKDNIKVMSVVREHPFKGKYKSGKLTESRHIITQINDKIYDPTRTQYGMYDDYEFDNVPNEYSKITELPVDAYIRKDTDSKNDKFYFPQRIKDKGIEFSDNVSPRKQRILTKTLRKNPELLKTKGDSRIELDTFNVGTTFGTTTPVEEQRNGKTYYKPNEYKVAFNERIFTQKYDPKFINYVSKKTNIDDEITDEYLEKEIQALPVTQQKHSARHDVPRTLTHEFTHINQIESKQGNIEEFKEDYDKQTELFGYQENAYEIGARIGAEEQKRNRMYRNKDTDMNDVYFYNDIDVDIESKDKWGKPVEYYDTKGKIINVPIQEAYVKRGMYTLPRSKNIKLDRKEVDKKYFELYDDYKQKTEQERQEEFELEMLQGLKPTRNYSIPEPTFKQAKEKVFEEKAEELRKEGIIVKKPKINEYENEYNVKVRYTPNIFKSKIDNVMKPFNTPKEGSGSSKDLVKEYKQVTTKEEAQKVREKYLQEMKENIMSEDKEVPIVSVTDREIDNYSWGEGRHRILAAKELGQKTIPVYLEKRDIYSDTYDKYEGKEIDLENDDIDVDDNSKNKIIYRNEEFPGYNIPKPYKGKQKYKFRVLAKDKNNIGVVNFGHSDYEDYTIHKDPVRRKNFRARHNCDPVSELDKLSAKYWSCEYLW